MCVLQVWTRAGLKSSKRLQHHSFESLTLALLALLATLNIPTATLIQVPNMEEATTEYGPTSGSLFFRRIIVTVCLCIPFALLLVWHVYWQVRKKLRSLKNDRCTTGSSAGSICGNGSVQAHDNTYGSFTSAHQALQRGASEMLASQSRTYRGHSSSTLAREAPTSSDTTQRQESFSSASGVRSRIGQAVPYGDLEVRTHTCTPQHYF